MVTWKRCDACRKTVETEETSRWGRFTDCDAAPHDICDECAERLFSSPAVNYDPRYPDYPYGITDDSGHPIDKNGRRI